MINGCLLFELAAQKERMKRLFGDGDDSDDDSYYDRTGAGQFFVMHSMLPAYNFTLTPCERTQLKSTSLERLTRVRLKKLKPTTH